MKPDSDFALLVQGFFTQRLMGQRNASPHTIKSYRDTFCLLIKFAQTYLGKPPSKFALADIDVLLITSFLDNLENERGISARSRNVRLAAIRSFFRYAALEAPMQSAQIQRVLSVPSKRHTKAVISFLTKPEIDAILAAPDRTCQAGRRDYALLLLALQTGLRLSELTALTKDDLVLGRTAYVRVLGKGRKERTTPLTKQTSNVLKGWIQESASHPVLFPSARGKRLSADGVQYIVEKHVTAASKSCPSLSGKRVTPHVLRHYSECRIMPSAALHSA